MTRCCAQPDLGAMLHGASTQRTAAALRVHALVGGDFSRDTAMQDKVLRPSPGGVESSRFE